MTRGSALVAHTPADWVPLNVPFSGCMLKGGKRLEACHGAGHAMVPGGSWACHGAGWVLGTLRALRRRIIHALFVCECSAGSPHRADAARPLFVSGRSAGSLHRADAAHHLLVCAHSAGRPHRADAAVHLALIIPESGKPSCHRPFLSQRILPESKSTHQGQQKPFSVFRESENLEAVPPLRTGLRAGERPVQRLLLPSSCVCLSHCTA